MLTTILLAAVSYVGTNLDDIFLLTLFFSEAKTKSARLCIILGQSLGILLLYGVSVLGALGLSFLPEKCVGLLGVLPILLGIKAIFPHEDEAEGSKRSAGSALRVTLVALANGADNIGVYVPLFTGLSLAEIALTGIVFLVMTGFWCMLGKKLSDLPWLRRFLVRYKRIIVPLVLILLGVFLLADVFFGSFSFA